jgi:GPI mannosyltransferase 3
MSSLAGYPTILFTLLPVALLGIYWSRRRMYALLTLWTAIAYSFMSHKEFRFVLPTLPLCMMYCGVAFYRILEPEKYFAGDRKKSDEKRKPVKKSSVFSLLLLLLLLSNIPLAAYFSYVHQRGPDSLVKHVHMVSDFSPSYPLFSFSLKDKSITNLLMLMPCHSTPFYSHIHRNITIRMLDCSPRYEATVSPYRE